MIFDCLLQIRVAACDRAMLELHSHLPGDGIKNSFESPVSMSIRVYPLFGCFGDGHDAEEFRFKFQGDHVSVPLCCVACCQRVAIYKRCVVHVSAGAHGLRHARPVKRAVFSPVSRKSFGGFDFAD